jgi:protein-tyrosine phosphatase
MNRIDVHCHFLPQLDDGCQSLADSLTCLRMMAAAGYARVFCTPHCGSNDFTDLSVPEVAERVRSLQGHVVSAGIPVTLRPGGELRLSPYIAEELPAESGGLGVPTFGHAGKYVLADLWEPEWPAWANRAVEWLQKRGHTVIIAHPERMPALRAKPALIHEIAALGVLFQGNLGPIAGADAADIVALARRFLVEGRYFMVGTDGHRPSHLCARLAGHKVIEDLVGPAKLEELTVTHPSRLWD